MGKNNIPIYVVIGTRAQFIKMAPVLYEMKRQGVEYTLIYTVQHKENVQEILDVYGLRKPDVVIYEGEESNTMKKGIKWTLDMLFKSLFKAKNYLPERGIVLTHGDTFTAWLAALMGKRAGCKVAHVESGLRSFNIFRPFPEEISRLITFSLSDIYFCADEWAINNLRKYKGDKVDIGANTMLDGVKYAVENPKETQFDFQREPYILVSIHRYENIFKDRFTETIIPYLKEISKKHKLVITLHPTTRERLKKLNLYDELDKDERIILHERFDFIDWINVCNDAEFVISDGGSNQEELSYLGVPTILFREETERKEGLGENIVLSKFDKAIIDDFVVRYEDFRRKALFEDVSPSERIVDYLKNKKEL
jgi:UDP-N-acetylglucosamine 2-epimerase (non-hydrolysing)